MRVRSSSGASAKTKRARKPRLLVEPGYYYSTLSGAHVVTIPLYTRPECNGSIGNSRLAGIVRAGIRKTQRAKVTERIQPYVVATDDIGEVLMIRLSPGLLDTGNLWSALKAVQDAIAKHLGVNDGPNSPVRWSVAQEKSRAYGVRVEFRTKVTQLDLTQPAAAGMEKV